MKNSRSLPKGSLPATVSVPPSKSYANRALIVASHQPHDMAILGLPKAKDVSDLLGALEVLGLRIIKTENDCVIHGSFPACETADRSIAIGEGGTSARFLACLLAKGQKRYELIMSSRLAKRPWQEFIDFMRSHGGMAELKENRLSLQGPVLINEELLEVDCQRTTQFASGIQLTQDVNVRPLNLKASESYWEMTLYLSEILKVSSQFRIPLDWSSASYPMVFAALNHRIHFPGLRHDAYQADAKLYGILKELGALEDSQEGITVIPMRRPCCFNLEVTDCLDLVPALVFLLAHIEGRHTLRGLDNLIHKESDRLSGIMQLLEVFERETSFALGELQIVGRKNLVGVRDLQLENDHRMVMAAALFLRHHSGGSLSPALAVNKSYPEFFQLFDH